MTQTLIFNSAYKTSYGSITFIANEGSINAKIECSYITALRNIVNDIINALSINNKVVDTTIFAFGLDDIVIDALLGY